MAYHIWHVTAPRGGEDKSDHSRTSDKETKGYISLASVPRAWNQVNQTIQDHAVENRHINVTVSSQGYGGTNNNLDDPCMNYIR